MSDHVNRGWGLIFEVSRCSTRSFVLSCTPTPVHIPCLASFTPFRAQDTSGPAIIQQRINPAHSPQRMGNSAQGRVQSPDFNGTQLQSWRNGDWSERVLLLPTIPAGARERDTLYART